MTKYICVDNFDCGLRDKKGIKITHVLGKEFSGVDYEKHVKKMLDAKLIVAEKDYVPRKKQMDAKDAEIERLKDALKASESKIDELNAKMHEIKKGFVSKP